MKLDTEHYTESKEGTVYDKEGRIYIFPVGKDRVRLYPGGGFAFDTRPKSDHEGINAEFARRGIRPPYVP